MLRTGLFISLPAIAFLLASQAAPSIAQQAAENSLAFERHIAPLFIKHCLDCHNESMASGGLSLVDRQGAMAGGESGAVLVAGNPEESYLLDRVTDGSMPPEGKGEPLSPDERSRLKAWIAAGCSWPEDRRLSLYELTTARRAGFDWWSFLPVRKPEVPTEAGAASPIDAFVIARLRQQGLRPAGRADRLTLVRRATFDLTGLPPTPEEVQAFLADESADAYPRLLDRLLASPRYGQRWAQHWLDVVRFSESKGFERDRIRENAWRYRDWVIDALNRDMPFDEFVRRQIAGDALAPDDPQASIPTGFLVTGPNNDVGNGSELERKRERMDELDDFVTNTTAAFLGLTVGCARCHDHKFDPIPTRDYYRLVAVFAGVYYGDRPLAADSQIDQRQLQLKSFDDRLATVDQRLTSLEKQFAELQGGAPNAVKNEVEFDPVDARFVRMDITRTADGTEACIDELEVFAAGIEENLANAAHGAAATASSLLPGFAIHKVAHLNDGQFGNEHSWIAGKRGACWAQIELPKTAPVNKVVWGRDRQRHYTDRVPAAYEVLVSLDGKSWRVVAERPLPKSNSSEDLARLDVLKKERETLLAQRRQIESEKNALPAFTTTWAPISKSPEPTHLLKRGDVTTPADEVTPGALCAVKTLSPDLAASQASDRQRRLALADWIASPLNPLTARVVVNRLWQHHIGAGLVENPSDFGFNGGLPSHPELLDWLAAELIERGWSLKAMHRAIMRSAVYQQRWIADEHAARVDADNRLLWRANRRRLEAEAIRDSILYTAGTLDETMGGPSFRLFKYTDGNIPIYEPLSGEDRSTWRRSIYRHIVRSHSVPFLDVFDCPDSSVMTAKRSRTTTALQALSLLNNAFVAGQSEQFAERLRREAGNDPVQQARRAAWLILNRPASDEELRLLGEFVEHHGLSQLGRVLWNANEFLYVN